MWGSEICSGNNPPLDAVPCRLNGGDNSGERAASVIAKKSRGILCHKHPWLDVRNNS
jgi:hypothetical protein